MPTSAPDELDPSVKVLKDVKTLFEYVMFSSSSSSLLSGETGENVVNVVLEKVATSLSSSLSSLFGTGVRDGEFSETGDRVAEGSAWEVGEADT